MVKLIAVKRMDRNGKMVTRHIRDDLGASLPTAVPAPSLGSPKRQRKLAEFNSPRLWNVNVGEWQGADPDLATLCSTQYPASQSFKCSDAEFYDVLRVVHPINVLPLLAIGIRTEDAATRFLDETGFSRLKTDEFISERSVESEIPATSLIEFTSKYKQHAHNPRFIDAAECWSLPFMHAADNKRVDDSLPPLKAITQMVLDDEISWSDIKEVGAKKVAESAIRGTQLVDILTGVKNGTSGFKSAREVFDVLTEISRSPERNLKVADAFGFEGYQSIHQKDVWIASSYADALKTSDFTPEEKSEIFQYSLEIDLNFSVAEAVSLYKAGIDVEDAQKGLLADMSVNQIIGLDNKEVTPSLSSGYL